MGSKYIRNTDDATIVCKIPSDKNKSFVFPSRKVDKRNNIILSNGYSEISEEDLELLRAESSTFQFYEKAGKLSLVDELPQDAMSPEQLVMSLRTENELLKQKLAEGSSEDIKALKEQLDAANAKIEEQEKMIDALDAQLAEMADELNAYEAKPKDETNADDNKSGND